MTTRSMSADALEDSVARAEWTVDRLHERAAHHREDGDRGAITGLGQGKLRARRIRWKIGGAHHVVGSVEYLEDFVFAIDVIAHRHDVHTGFDQFLIAFHGEAGATRGILGVTNDQSQPPARNEPRQDLAHDLTARCADHITDEQDLATTSKGSRMWDSRPRLSDPLTAEGGCPTTEN